ncbi:hypothetical protein ACFV42_23475 [Streptomyces solisilvae]|uniref:hypothetical protein n=1 Tax=Streptomyces malaysiensis TaxID=92644 RepID=UPI003682DBDD
MAGCGTSCRRLRGENGVKVEPDCCGGCVVSIDPASLPPGGSGINEQRAKEIADAAAKAAVDNYAQTDTQGLPADQVRQVADQAARDAVNAYAATDPKGVTSDQAQEIADKAADDAKRAAEECCNANANAIKAGDDALDQRVKALEDAPPPGAGVTKEEAQKIADDTVKGHVDTCHTLKINTDKTGVTPEQGWEVDGLELRSIGGVNTAFMRLKRTGEPIYSEGPDFQSEGLPSQGNIVPDLLIATAAEQWRPAQSYEVGAYTSYGSGSVRVQPDGKIYLLDWTYNNPLRTDHLLRFEYEFLTKTACESGEGGGGPTPPSGGVTEDKAQEIADAAAQKAVKGHVDTCHTLKINTDKSGVTPEQDWEVDLVELRSIGGTHTAFIRLNRTGGNLTSKDADFLGEQGQHEEGNIVPDLLIATVSDDWRPPQTYLTSAHTSYGSGSVRIHPDGKVYLLDWMTNNVLQTGHTLRFEYEFLTKTACESGEGGGETPAPAGGVSKEEAQQIAQQAITVALAQYPSEFADNFDNIDVTSDQWAALDPPVSVKIKIPPSRKVQVTTCFTARNTETRIQTYQAVEVAAGDAVLITPSDSRAVTLSSDSPGDPSSACHSMIIDFTKLNDGSVKAGDEVTFTAKNRKANTPEDPGTGVSTVLDRNVSVVSLIGAVPAGPSAAAMPDPADPSGRARPTTGN